MVLYRWIKSGFYYEDGARRVFVSATAPGVVRHHRRFISEVADDEAHFAVKVGDDVLKFRISDVPKSAGDIQPHLHAVDGIQCVATHYPEDQWQAIYAGYEKFISEQAGESDADDVPHDIDAAPDTDAHAPEQADDVMHLKAEVARLEAKLQAKAGNAGTGTNSAMGRAILFKAPTYNEKKTPKANRDAFSDWFRALERHANAGELHLEDVKFALVSSNLPQFVRNEAGSIEELGMTIERYCVKGQASAMDAAIHHFDKHGGLSDFNDAESFLNSLMASYSEFKDCGPECEVPEKLKGWFALTKANLDRAQKAVVLGAIKNSGGMSFATFKDVLIATCTNDSSVAENSHKLLMAGKGSGTWCDICRADTHWTSRCKHNSRSKDRKGGKPDKGGKRSKEEKGAKGPKGGKQ